MIQICLPKYNKLPLYNKYKLRKLKTFNKIKFIVRNNINNNISNNITTKINISISYSNNIKIGNSNNINIKICLFSLKKKSSQIYKLKCKLLKINNFKSIKIKTINNKKE